MASMDSESSDSSRTDTRIPYFRLLNTLANDLDSVLNDLYTTPPSTLGMSGDAFLEPYMQALSNDVIHSGVDEVFDGSSNVFKKRIQEDYPPNEDRTSSFSSPVNSLDTPLDEKTESHFRLVELNAGSQGSLNQLISGDECSEASTENSSLAGDEETSCDITLLERLVRSHPIWFLPGIQRAGAFHLLQGKEDGNFIVRQSSHNSTMAISVRLPVGKGPYIEHYLIQGAEDGQLGLESSDNKFPSIPLLIAHYCQCCDELPVQLTLPRAIREAKNRQQLTSFALLGQEFWRYPMANPRQSLKIDEESLSPLPTVAMKESNRPSQNASFPSGSSSSSSNSPASSLSSFESSSNNNNSALEQSSLGFDTDSNILAEESPSQSNSLMTTFKGSTSFSCVPYNQIGIPVSSESPSSLPVETSQPQPITVRRPRPTPPSTLNLSSTTASAIAKNSPDNRTENSSPPQMLLVTPTGKAGPPPPPPRWTKPSLAGSCGSSAQNVTVMTPLTVTHNKETSPPPSDAKLACVQLSSPVDKADKHITSSQQMVHTSSLAVSLPTIAPTPLPRSLVPQVTSPSPSNCSQVLSPVSEGNTRPFGKRSRRRKESTHYQESDIIYYGSTAADKASDYEDIWGTDTSVSTFKPQPPPRSLPFSPLDDLTSKNPTKKPFTSLTPDVCERSVLITPALTPAEPSPRSVVNENRFGMVLDTSIPETACVVSPSTSVAALPVVTPQTPVSSERKSPVQAESAAVDPKLGSPFYAEPADSIKHEACKRRTRPTGFVTPLANRNRHSDPSAFHQWPPGIAGTGVLERIDSKEELITNSTFSTSVDNLVILRNSRRRSAGSSSSTLSQPAKNVKPVEPPKLSQAKGRYNDATWAVDSSWEFIAKETNDDDEDDSKSDIYKNTYDDHKLLLEEREIAESENSLGRVLTFQDMIFQRLPELRLTPVFDKTSFDESDVSKRISIESSNNSSIMNDSNNNPDNTEKIYRNGLSGLSQISDNSDDAQTVFSEPWDSTQWEHLLTPTKQVAGEIDSGQVNRCKSFKERLDPLLSPPRLKALAKTRAENTAPGATIRAYAFKLAADNETVFAQTIHNFITCTRDSRETKPQVVMRNMRQFMSGMKNYLVTHGEREFIKEVESERSKLKSTEFLNLDAILEGVMHKLVITPLKEHLSELFVKEYEANGALLLLIDNIKYARTKPPSDLGVRKKLILPASADLQKIFDLFKRLQQADSPLEKMEFLLAAIAAIFHSVKAVNSKPEAIFLGADDFLPIFVWVLVQTGMVAAEVEAEYMWGLLHPSLLSGEGGYYLTTLSSAVNVLKNFTQSSNTDSLPAVSWCSDPMAEFKCVLKVVVPNELNGSLLTKTLPVRPNMTTKDICKIIALKLRITNPQDYALFRLVDGEELILNETECPQDVKSELAKVGKHCLFAYKRIDAKIAWPHSTNPSQQPKH